MPDRNARFGSALHRSGLTVLPGTPTNACMPQWSVGAAEPAPGGTHRSGWACREAGWVSRDGIGARTHALIHSDE